MPMKFSLPVDAAHRQREPGREQLQRERVAGGRRRGGAPARRSTRTPPRRARPCHPADEVEVDDLVERGRIDARRPSSTSPSTAPSANRIGTTAPDLRAAPQPAGHLGREAGEAVGLHHVVGPQSRARVVRHRRPRRRAEGRGEADEREPDHQRRRGDRGATRVAHRVRHARASPVRPRHRSGAPDGARPAAGPRPAAASRRRRSTPNAPSATTCTWSTSPRDVSARARPYTRSAPPADERPTSPATTRRRNAPTARAAHVGDRRHRRHARGAHGGEHGGDHRDHDADERATRRPCGRAARSTSSGRSSPMLAQQLEQPDPEHDADARARSPTPPRPPRTPRARPTTRPDRRSRPSPAADPSSRVRWATRIVKVLKMMKAPTTTPIAAKPSSASVKKPRNCAHRLADLSTSPPPRSSTS